MGNGRARAFRLALGRLVARRAVTTVLADAKRLRSSVTELARRADRALGSFDRACLRPLGDNDEAIDDEVRSSGVAELVTTMVDMQGVLQGVTHSIPHVEQAPRP